MAERSKAPDSRVRLFPSLEYSGPRMWAWVRIPLLTNPFFLNFHFNYHFLSIITDYHYFQLDATQNHSSQNHENQYDMNPITQFSTHLKYSGLVVRQVLHRKSMVTIGRRLLLFHILVQELTPFRRS